MSLLGRPRRKLPWTELRERFLVVLPDAKCSDEPAWVAWHEGPSIASVQEAMGELPGWQWKAVRPGLSVPLPPGDEGSILWMRRSLGTASLGRAVVRFYAAHNRYFTTDQDRYWQRFADICDHDVPAPISYPIIEHITEALLTLPDPDPSADDASADEIDRLSARLRRHGYERLWAEAFKAVS
jgi:hypothetical protein